jgi:hypothetical protein
MTRSLIAVASGTLFAAPACADYETGLKPNEIHPGVTYGQVDVTTNKAPAAEKSRAEVRAEFKASGSELTERHKENVGLDPEVDSSGSMKTRAQVRADVRQAYREGELIENAELGEAPPRM